MANKPEIEAAQKGRIGMMPPRPEPRITAINDAEKKYQDQLSTGDKLKSKMAGPLPPGICSKHRILNCPDCTKKSGNDNNADKDQTLDNDNDQTLDEQHNPKLTKTPRLVFEKKELTEEQLKQLQKEQPNTIFCQSLVPLQTIAKQFHLFINALAQQQGLTYQQFMDQNPGFQCQQNGHVLEITIPNRATLYNFLEQLGQNNMIKMPNELKQQMSEFRSQQPTIDNSSQQPTQEETASASPFNPTPFSMKPTPQRE